MAHKRNPKTGPVGWEIRRPPAAASTPELLWYFFPGDVEMNVDSTVLASSVGSIPALHFMVAMVAASATVADAESAVAYQLTEIDHQIHLTRTGESVRVSASFSDVVLCVPLEDFRREVCRFTRQTLSELTTAYPGLSDQPLVGELRASCGT